MARSLRAAAFGFLALAAAGTVFGGEAPSGASKQESSRPVVAAVNGEIITDWDLVWNLGPVAKILRGPPEEKLRQLQVLREKALRELLLTEIVVQEARRSGVKVSDGMLRQKIQEEAHQAGGPASYHRLLKEKDQTYAENWERVRRDIYIEEYRHRLLLSRSRTRFLLRVPEIQVAPKEARAFYRRHSGEFQEAVPGLFRMIRLDFDKFATRQAARDLADTLLAAVREAKDPAERTRVFADLARKHSSDKHAAEGGAWELRAEADLVPDLHAKVSLLKPGEPSDVVDQEYGLFLFLLERGMGKKQKPFEQVRDLIEERLRLEALQARWEEESRLLLRSARVWPREAAQVLEKAEEEP